MSKRGLSRWPWGNSTKVREVWLPLPFWWSHPGSIVLQYWVSLVFLSHFVPFDFWHAFWHHTEPSSLCSYSLYDLIPLQISKGKIIWICLLRYNLYQEIKDISDQLYQDKNEHQISYELISFYRVALHLKPVNKTFNFSELLCSEKNNRSLLLLKQAIDHIKRCV